MSVILGINSFHSDSSAALIVDGVLIGAIAEERLGKRIKHDPSFPINAIRFLLSHANLKVKDVTHIAIPKNTQVNMFAKMNYTLKNLNTSLPAVKEFFQRKNKIDNFKNYLEKVFGESSSLFTYRVVNVEHHLAHISSAYYASEFESKTVGFSYDGSGDFTSLMLAECEGNKIKIKDRLHLPSSLGFFYTALCQFIGFEKFGEEYKVMGLAPYGNDAYKDEMNKLLPIQQNSKWFSLPDKYFKMHSGGECGALDSSGHVHMSKIYKESFQDLFGFPRKRTEPINQKQKDIAKSTQLHFERVLMHCINSAYELIPSNQIAMAGGCALNGVGNAMILRESPFDKQFIQPAASDDGTALGAAYWCLFNKVGYKHREIFSPYLGGGYSFSNPSKHFNDSSYEFYECLDSNELTYKAASLIADNKVIGWYQGRSEWGPRALGNRSILANPLTKNMKDIINLKIKRRESFRPFAPSILEEDVSEYFEQTVVSPFMQHVVKFKEKYRGIFPAVVHVDGTGRLQTVSHKSNPLYYKLISELKKVTGHGIILNTSFNENEPVVETPQEAIDCFVRTDMDCLCLNNWIISKKNK